MTQQQQKLIVPTIGRIVWFRSNFGGDDNRRPCAAIVTDVYGDRLVSLCVFNHFGRPSSETSVILVQPGEDIPENNASYCEWMSYQVGQAAKIDETLDQKIRNLIKESSNEDTDSDVSTGR